MAAIPRPGTILLGSGINAGNSLATKITLGILSGRVSTQVDKTDANLVNITGLSVNLITGSTYRFRAALYINADTVGGLKLAMNGTATFSSLIYQINVINTAANSFAHNSRQTAYDGAGSAVGATGVYAEIVGTIVCNGTGTLTPRFAQSTASGTSSVLVNSTFVAESF